MFVRKAILAQRTLLMTVLNAKTERGEFKLVLKLERVSTSLRFSGRALQKNCLQGYDCSDFWLNSDFYNSYIRCLTIKLGSNNNIEKYQHVSPTPSTCLFLQYGDDAEVDEDDFESRIKQLRVRMMKLMHPNGEADYPARSCKDLFKNYPVLPDGTLRVVESLPLEPFDCFNPV